MVDCNLKLIHASNWKKSVIDVLDDKIKSQIAKSHYCNVMLTGGSTAKSLYENWAQSLIRCGPINFYWGDERFLPQSDKNNNYNLALRSLFKVKNNKLSLFPINTDLNSAIEAAEKYDKALPDKIDILLLSLGEDGHIASLFPFSQSLKVSDKKVISVTGPAPFKERISITKSVIENASFVLVLVVGKSKGEALKLAFSDNATHESSPILLIKDGLVFLDDQAFEVFKID